MPHGEAGGPLRPLFVARAAASPKCPFGTPIRLIHLPMPQPNVPGISCAASPGFATEAVALQVRPQGVEPNGISALYDGERSNCRGDSTDASLSDSQQCGFVTDWNQGYSTVIARRGLY